MTQPIPSPAQVAAAQQAQDPENAQAVVAEHLADLTAQVELLVDGAAEDAETVLERAELLHGTLQSRLSEAQA